MPRRFACDGAQFLPPKRLPERLSASQGASVPPTVPQAVRIAATRSTGLPGPLFVPIRTGRGRFRPS